MHKITIKDMYQVECDLGKITNYYSKQASNDVEVYGTIATVSAIAGSILLCISSGLLFALSIPGFAACFTGVILCGIALKMSIYRMRYFETIVAAYDQRDELEKFKALME